jgi:hypothetical protein
MLFFNVSFRLDGVCVLSNHTFWWHDLPRYIQICLSGQRMCREIYFFFNIMVAEGNLSKQLLHIP